MPRLTKTLVKTLADNAGAGERLVMDTEVRGFGLRVRAGARATYFFRYAFGGRRRGNAWGHPGRNS
jgi:hypothetical protein